MNRTGRIKTGEGGFISALAGFCPDIKILRTVPYRLNRALSPINNTRFSPVFFSSFFLLFQLFPPGVHSQTEVAVSSSNFSEKMESRDFRERRAALDYVSGSKLKNRKELLKKALNDKDPIIREKAAIAMGKEKDAEAMGALIGNLKSEDQVLRLSSMEGLREFPKSAKAVSSVAGMLSHEDRNTRWKAAEVLGGMKSDLGTAALLKTAKEDSDEFVRKASVESLGKIGTQKALAALKTLKAGADEKLSLWAGNVIKAYGWK